MSELSDILSKKSKNVILPELFKISEKQKRNQYRIEIKIYRVLNIIIQNKPKTKIVKLKPNPNS